MNDLTTIDTQFTDAPQTALTRQQDASLSPVQSIEQAIAFRANVVEFTRRIMVKDQDYGTIPGTQKPTLLKPGAEKLCQHFGLADAFDIIEKIEDWTGADHGGEPLFSYTIRCRLSRNGLPVSEGVGVCHSWEKKYRYRTVYANKATADDKQRGKLITKNGKNNSTYQVYQLPNEEVYDLINTFVKMAKKRAFIDAMLRAVSASEFYTQDTEDIMPSAATVETTPEYVPEPPQEPERDLPVEMKARKLALGAGKISSHAISRQLLILTDDTPVTLEHYEKALELSEDRWRNAIAVLQAAAKPLELISTDEVPVAEPNHTTDAFNDGIPAREKVGA